MRNCHRGYLLSTLNGEVVRVDGARSHLGVVGGHVQADGGAERGAQAARFHPRRHAAVRIERELPSGLQRLERLQVE